MINFFEKQFIERLIDGILKHYKYNYSKIRIKGEAHGGIIISLSIKDHDWWRRKEIIKKNKSKAKKRWYKRWKRYRWINKVLYKLRVWKREKEKQNKKKNIKEDVLNMSWINNLKFIIPSDKLSVNKIILKKLKFFNKKIEILLYKHKLLKQTEDLIEFHIQRIKIAKKWRRLERIKYLKSLISSLKKREVEIKRFLKREKSLQFWRDRVKILYKWRSLVSIHRLRIIGLIKNVLFLGLERRIILRIKWTRLTTDLDMKMRRIEDTSDITKPKKSIWKVKKLINRYKRWKRVKTRRKDIENVALKSWLLMYYLEERKKKKEKR